MEPILIELARKPLDLILGFGVYVAAFIALALGFISLRIQKKARKERTKQEEHKANKLRFKISRELLDLTALYENAINTGSIEKRKLILSPEYPIDDLRAILSRLEHMHGLEIMLEAGEIALLEAIIDITRVFAHNSKLDIDAFEKTAKYIAGLNKILWAWKRAYLQTITSEELEQTLRVILETVEEGDNEEDSNSEPQGRCR